MKLYKQTCYSVLLSERYNIVYLDLTFASTNWNNVIFSETFPIIINVENHVLLSIYIFLQYSLMNEKLKRSAFI